MKELTPKRFDHNIALAGADRAPRERIIWTLSAIGARIGVGPDFIRSMVDLPGSPVHRMNGRFYAIESELLNFMKSGGTDQKQTR